MAASKINNAETGVRETYAILSVESGVVRTTVGEHPYHAPKGIQGYLASFEIEHSCDTTHSGLFFRAMAWVEVHQSKQIQHFL
jgi:hypothetical protein